MGSFCKIPPAQRALPKWLPSRSAGLRPGVILVPLRPAHPKWVRLAFPSPPSWPSRNPPAHASPLETAGCTKTPIPGRPSTMGSFGKFGPRQLALPIWLPGAPVSDPACFPSRFQWLRFVENHPALRLSRLCGASPNTCQVPVLQLASFRKYPGLAAPGLLPFVSIGVYSWFPSCPAFSGFVL